MNWTSKPASLALTALCIGLTACQPADSLKIVESRPVKDVVLDDLKSPWSIAFVSNEEALITEKEGDLVLVNLVNKTKTIIGGFGDDKVSDIHSVRRGDNSGLFDVVLDPDFKANKYVYVAYAAEKDRAFTTKIIRGVLRDNELQDVETLFVAEPFTKVERYHYGGGLLFGADGKLYITIGERLFSEEDQPEFPIAQDLKDRRGKIYRLNSDGSIPDDNPDFGQDAVPGLYAVGIRAAQGLALNKNTGEIWFSEHGTHQGDELNRLEKGANYGWPVKTTGKYRYDDYDPPKMEGTVFTDPEWYWLQTVAPTGLAFYHGNEFPLWQDDLIVPGLSRGSLWRVDFQDGEIVALDELFVNDRVRSRKVAQSPDGRLFMLTDTRLTFVPGSGFKFEDAPSGQLIRIRNSARK